MPSEPKSNLEKQKEHDQSYCTDPTCKYCNDLRKMEEQWGVEKPIQRPLIFET